MRGPDLSDLRFTHDIGSMALAASRIPPAAPDCILGIILHRANNEVLRIDAAWIVAGVPNDILV
jgi:hypothetical protein